ncbi:MAG: DUF308 domain-containing protein [Eubacteriales bacterium]|nr:DUF308 domain-containing protein [Eubacteriales bacterium]
MDLYRKFRWNLLCIPLASIALGLVLLLWPKIAVLTLSTAAAVLLIALGLWQAIAGAVNLFRWKAAIDGWQLATGLIVLVLGIVLALFPKVLASLLPVFLGVVFVIDGVARLSIAFQAHAMGQRWAGALVFAMLTIAAGILLLINPFGGSALLAVLAGVLLLISGVSNVVQWFMLMKK